MKQVYLEEGYTARAVGNAAGSMYVSIRTVDGVTNELAVFEAADVPVLAGSVFTVEETAGSGGQDGTGASLVVTDPDGQAHTVPLTKTEGAETAPTDLAGLSADQIGTQTYTGQEIRPVPVIRDGQKVLTAGTDYTLAYADNVLPDTAKTKKASITVTGTGAYTGQLTLQFSIAEKAHHYGAWKIVRAASCAAAGAQERVCSVCGHKESKTLAATGKHTYGAWKTTKAASCAAAGTQERTCSVCGRKESKTIPATGKHTFGAWKVTKQATVLAAGEETRTCSVCKKTEKRTLARLKPTYQVNASSLLLKKGQTTTKLKITGLARGDSIRSWVSDAPKIVTVTSGGAIKGVKTGRGSVTAALASGVKITIPVTVQKKAVAAAKITGLPAKATLQVGQKLTLSPAVLPITCVEKIKYSSSNKKVAAVSSRGVITAKKSGRAKIKVKAGKKTFTVTVTVPKASPTGLKGVPSAVTLKKGKSKKLKVTILPKGADGKIRYTSSDPSVVTVSAKGVIKAKKKAGQAVVTVTCGGIRRTITVTVK